MIIFICVVLLLLLLSFMCYYIVFFSPHRGQNDDRKLPQGEQYVASNERMLALIESFLQLDFEDVEVISADGLKLHGRYYHVQDGAPVDICFHGYRGTGIRDFCGGARLAMELGHNVILVDQRAHGKSQGHSISFGAKERYDCESWINYALCRFGEDSTLNLLGVSMGASTVIMASGLKLPENVKHIVADCPYAKTPDIIKKVCADMKLPTALVYPFIYAGALIYGRFRLESGDCVSAVKKAKIPILIVHGEDDRFVPQEMSEAIQKAAPGLIHRVTFPGAAHGMSYIEDPVRYEAAVREFMKL